MREKRESTDKHLAGGPGGGEGLPGLEGAGAVLRSLSLNESCLDYEDRFIWKQELFAVHMSLAQTRGAARKISARWRAAG
jgi:hypothetical protein